MQKSETISELAKALVAVQKELKHAGKDSTAGAGSKFSYNYSNLEECITSSRELLTKNGLAVSQLVGKTDETIKLTTILIHESGEYLQTESSVPMITVGQNKAQGMGAAITYLRRYAYQAIIGQASDDNDARGESVTSSSNGNSKAISEKQMEILRKNVDLLSKEEIEKLKAPTSMTPAEASNIIKEIFDGVRK